jgi:DNA-binding response OmpR family regulator
MSQGRILIVEDDPDVIKVVKAYLERDAFDVNVAYDGLTGLSAALNKAPSLIVLDWMLPGIDGLEFMKRLRHEQKTPVIMLTARKEEADRILGLELGADDYLTKPFSPRELVARIKAVLRRSREETPTEVIQEGNLFIDPSHRSAALNEKLLDLTKVEFDLLYVLAKNPGRVYSRNELLERVWGDDFIGVDRVVDVHISNLRHKLEPFARGKDYLITLRGIGYKFKE